MRGSERTVAVAIDVAGAMRGQVERVVEGALGWQVVSTEDTVLPPRCVLVDTARAPEHLGGTVPVVLLVDSDDLPQSAARAAHQAAAVVDGVPDAVQLREVVEAAVVAPTVGRAPWCTVAASAGGVGATTVATALAALRAWSHGPTLAAVSGPTHQADAPVVRGDELAGPAVWAAAASVVGVDDCRVVGLADAAPPPDAGSVPLVWERGVAPGPADVVVVRPDRSGLAAIEGHAGAVVVVGRGAVDPARCRQAARGQVLAEVPWSARVAAAAAVGRLPTDVPGAWLQPLLPVVDVLMGRAS